MMPRTAHHTRAKVRRGRDGVGTSPRAGVVETRVYVLVDTTTPLQGDHELFMRPGDLPIASLLTTRHMRGTHARWPTYPTSGRFRVAGGAPSAARRPDGVGAREVARLLAPLPFPLRRVGS